MAGELPEWWPELDGDRPVVHVTQYALSHGVPHVTAGDTEDEPEVSRRAEWAGVGLNLRTGTPAPEALPRAVDAMLGDRRYRGRAQVLAAQIRQYDTLASSRRNSRRLRQRLGCTSSEAVRLG